MYSKQKEIKEYLEDMATYYSILPKMRFRAEVNSCDWDNSTKMYTVTTADGKCYTANFVIRCTSTLHEPSIPEFKGMEEFGGNKFHSALWPRNTSIKNKKVAVVGTGASAVQVVPNIAKDVQSLHVFQRTPPWVYARQDGPYLSSTKVFKTRKKIIANET